jgi:hypothetical protein
VVLRKADKKEPAVLEVLPAPPAASPALTPEGERIAVTEIPAQEASQAEQKAETGSAGISPHEAFAYALEEIKEMIRSEFRALRAEIKLWRESK